MSPNIEALIDGMQALAADVFQRSSADQQRQAEVLAWQLVARANDEGLPVVAGILLAAADMLDRVRRAKVD